MDGPGRRKPTPPDAGKYVGAGLTWTLSTLLFLWLGTVVDGVVGTRPLFTVLGAFLGAGAGFYYMYYHLVIEPRKSDEERGSSRK